MHKRMFYSLATARANICKSNIYMNNIMGKKQKALFKSLKNTELQINCHKEWSGDLDWEYSTNLNNINKAKQQLWTKATKKKKKNRWAL